MRTVYTEKEDKISENVTTFVSEHNEKFPLLPHNFIWRNLLNCDVLAVGRGGEGEERRARATNLHALRVRDIALPYIFISLHFLLLLSWRAWKMRLHKSAGVLCVAYCRSRSFIKSRAIKTKPSASGKVGCATIFLAENIRGASSGLFADKYIHGREAHFAWKLQMERAHLAPDG